MLAMFCCTARQKRAQAITVCFGEFDSEVVSYVCGSKHVKPAKIQPNPGAVSRSSALRPWNMGGDEQDSLRRLTVMRGLPLALKGWCGVGVVATSWSGHSRTAKELEITSNLPDPLSIPRRRPGAHNIT